MVADAHTTSSIVRVLIGLAVTWGIIGLSGAGSLALDNEHTRATLRGVEGVYILIEGLPPDVEQAGLTKQQLQTDVELRLRKAGIRVLTREEAPKVSGQPLLYVSVGVGLPPNGLASYAIVIEFYQRAALDINALSTVVSTWSSIGFGAIGVPHVANIRNYVRDAVDNFINAYLSVNPRPTGSAAPSSLSPRRDLVR